VQRSKPECDVWIVLDKNNIVINKEFIFGAGPAHIALLGLLYAITDEYSAFTVPDNLGERFGWRASRVPSARRVLIRSGYLDLVRRARRKKHPSVYRWV
jgi:hypothetical protein